MYQSKEEKILKSKRGITLIALVVSIIVLLILAGVSIAMLTGENGILKKAGEASEKTKIATEEEQRQLTIAEAAMNFENTEYEDENGEKVTIPAGFAVSSVKGENTVDDGLVVIDSEGNEFVWIEVPIGNGENEANLEDKTTDDDIYNELVRYVDEYRKGASRQNYANWTDEFYDHCGLENKSSYNTLKSKMLNSIKDKGGFWVGRYEAGTDLWRNERKYVPKDTELVAFSQANKYPLSNVFIGDAQRIASNSSLGDYETSLMFGIQWDLIEKFFENKNFMSYDQMNNTTNFGNHLDSSFTINDSFFSASYYTNGTWTKIKGYWTKNSGESCLMTTRFNRKI